MELWSFALNKILTYFKPGELALWFFSVVCIVASFFIFGATGYLSLIASVIGVSALVFFAKGNPIGQVLIIIFAVLYAIISFDLAYYGEMITYLGMSAPMAAMALVSWVRNPYEKGHAEVKIERIRPLDVLIIFVLTLAVTVLFYFVLKVLGTASLIVSTVSVSTSFFAVCLSYKRSPYYALAYVANDLVLMVLWIIAALENTAHVSVVVCFTVFLINDTYSFISWLKMRNKQEKNAESQAA